MPAIHLLISALCECGLFVFFFLLTFPICIFPSSLFMHLTFSSISSSISYLPEYWTRSSIFSNACHFPPNLGCVDKNQQLKRCAASLNRARPERLRGESIINDYKKSCSFYSQLTLRWRVVTCKTSKIRKL